MLRRLSIVLFLSPGIAIAQTMVLATGELELASGTSLRVESPMAWQLNPGTAVINHGLIDFGSVGTLSEQPGAPITGDGIERAVWPFTGPLQDAEPGNLGLGLTTSYPDGGLTVERGHLPRIAANGTTGISRWYRVSTPVATAVNMDAVLTYDLTEIDGVLPSSLALFHASAPNGTWEPTPTVGNEPQQMLSAIVPAPELFITAFDLNAALSADASIQAGWRCWPTVFADGVTIASVSGPALREVHVRDASGRLVHQARFADARATARVQLNGLTAGAYALVINGGEKVFKLVKP